MVPAAAPRVPYPRMSAPRLIDDLTRLALEADADPAILPGADELGQRRPADVPFLAWRARRMGLPARPAVPSVGAAGVDVRLWRALAESGAVDAEAAVTARQEEPGPLLAPSLVGPMGGIEVWTETELGALHAMSWGAILAADRDEYTRVLGIARWHIEHTQPDNATNRPWAIHLFMLLGEADASPEARLYAQTLAHNCRVAMGVPDAVSAQILFDGADAIGAAVDAGLWKPE